MKDSTQSKQSSTITDVDYKNQPIRSVLVFVHKDGTDDEDIKFKFKLSALELTNLFIQFMNDKETNVFNIHARGDEYIFGKEWILNNTIVVIEDLDDIKELGDDKIKTNCNVINLSSKKKGKETE